ncbi:MAG: undecaprenyldiphospho-muramoylpentapeptide beta-N-acetylglucosaminyltransferase [Chloroflexota bacterium]|jgi:UDP-N-acetylglucosamine--N-acetylmuramyl-(pentapeptide) pyrophosphoryl-undecaprenol N-acetylglucosamine transferase
MRVLLAGGGSGGSSAPVLAVAQELRKRTECEFLYIGTSSGPELELVSRMGIPFRSVQTGKLRRYWSWQNLVDLFRIPMGLIQSLATVAKFRPHLAFAAGGFAAVPPLMAASILRVPTVIHQQDVEPGLANKILAPFANKITVTFPSSLAHFPSSKTTVTGNPVRHEILSGSREEAKRLFTLRDDLPVVLVTGGGTGALGLNRLVASAAKQLTSNCQILHITGKGKRVELPDSMPNYRQMEFLAEGMGHALAAADLVVSRAGLSTLTELAALGKPSIIIPMPRSHQNANAQVFSKAQASVVYQEAELDGAKLAESILSLLQNREQLESMSERARALMPPLAEARIADVIESAVYRGKTG